MRPILLPLMLLLTCTGCKALVPTLACIACLPIFVGQALHRSPRIALASDEKMIESVLAIVPLGTSLDRAEAVMKAKGFTCSRESLKWDTIRSPVLDEQGEDKMAWRHMPGPYLECEGYYADGPLSGVTVFFRITHDDAGTVTGVRVSRRTECI